MSNEYTEFDEHTEYDAFNAGIEPGGLRNKNEIKILICYIIKTIDTQISKQQINEVIQGQGLANYFEVNQAISELIQNGSLDVDKDNEDLLSITQIGKMAASTLELDLPRSVREKAIKSAIKIITIAKNEQENNVKIEQLNNGYHITFTIADKNDIMMQLKLFVADKEQIEIVKRNFFEDPSRLYSSIISSLTVE